MSFTAYVTLFICLFVAPWLAKTGIRAAGKLMDWLPLPNSPRGKYPPAANDRRFVFHGTVFGALCALCWTVIALRLSTHGWAIAGALFGGLVPSAFLTVTAVVVTLLEWAIAACSYIRTLLRRIAIPTE